MTSHAITVDGATTTVWYSPNITQTLKPVQSTDADRGRFCGEARSQQLTRARTRTTKRFTAAPKRSDRSRRRRCYFGNWRQHTIRLLAEGAVQASPARVAHVDRATARPARRPRSCSTHDECRRENEIQRRRKAIQHPRRRAVGTMQTEAQSRKQRLRQESITEAPLSTAARTILPFSISVTVPPPILQATG
jgi:hypothetical protein